MIVEGAYPVRTPVFLVLMATRNGEAWLGQQLASVLQQRDVEIFLRVSDDASSDGTVALLRRAAQSDTRIELLPETAPSGSACANFLRLIRSVQPDCAPGYTHVALCDQDDVWQPDKLRRAAMSMSRNSVDLYSSAVTAEWPSGKVKDLVQRSVLTEADYLFEGAGQGCTFVLSRALFEKVHAVSANSQTLLAPLHYHDWLIYALARTWKMRWLYDPVPTLVYRQHASNDTGARGSTAGMRLRVDRISSGWYAQQVRAMLKVCRHVESRCKAAGRSEAMMNAARTSVWGRLRWAGFLLTRSRRRLSDRMVLTGFALLGMF